MFPDNIYKIVLEEGPNPVIVELSGEKIVELIRASLPLDTTSTHEV
tara:strand:- start:8886 stop:9023 length:138 start_codon:yes stop_codon:yes gene_type:complete